jgi:SAM-dependent methyltransferase
MDVAAWIRANYWTRMAYLIASDIASRARYRMGIIDMISGSTHTGMSTAQSVDYVEEVFSDYKRYGGVGAFHGKVAEVGPGDNCGVGLLFLDDGADRVDLVDRFYSPRDAVVHASVYRALAERHPRIARIVEGADLTDERMFPGLTRHYGADAAAENFFHTNRGYQFIVSRAVFEHVYDPVAALSSMARALDPGGMLLHKVDLRDHDLFSSYFHELKYLEVPSSLYMFMTQGTGRPNRVLFHTYRSALERLGLDAKLLVTRLAGVGPIEPHLPYDQIAPSVRATALDYVRSVQPRMARVFRTAHPEDVSVTGFFIVAAKPPA